MLRNLLAVDGHQFRLAQNTDMGQLKHEFEDAVRSGGRFVDVVVVGNRLVSVLVSPGVPVVMESTVVDFDVRDTGDVSWPFDEVPGEDPQVI